MTAMSGSMAPDIPPSRIAASHPVDADTFKTADVIAYHPADNIAGGHTSGPWLADTSARSSCRGPAQSRAVR
jgi:hypothetical protein